MLNAFSFENFLAILGIFEMILEQFTSHAIPFGKLPCYSSLEP